MDATNAITAIAIAKVGGLRRGQRGDRRKTARAPIAPNYFLTAKNV